MPTGILLVGLLFLVLLFIVVYKRQMLLKMFSINIASMADEFRAQMETTADQAVKKLENQMAQLEYILEEADAKILMLEHRLQQAERQCACQPAVSAQQTIDPVLLSPAAFSDDARKGSLDIQGTPGEAQTAVPNSHLLQPQQVKAADVTRDIAQDKRHQVLLLHRQGYTVVDIAKATSMGKGEVMLVLELNKNG